MEKIKEINFYTIKRNTNKAIILLHGYGANCHDLAPLNEYFDSKGEYSFYFPNGPISPQMMGGFGSCWFDIRFSEYINIPTDERVKYFSKLKPADFTNSLNMLIDSITEISNKYDEIILGGFSQGSMMALHLASKLKSLGKIKKLIIFSGALLNKEGLNSIDIPIFQSHGEQDPVLEYGAAQYLKQFLLDQNSRLLFDSFNGGHEIPLSVLTKAKKWMIE